MNKVQKDGQAPGCRYVSDHFDVLRFQLQKFLNVEKSLDYGSLY